MLSGLRAIYFDLDDTLCAYWDAAKVGLREAFAAHLPAGQTVEGMYAAWSEAFRDFCPNLRELGYYERYLVEGGHTRIEQMRRTLAVLGIKDEELTKRLSDTYLARRHANLTLFPDALPLLDSLRDRYKLGLMTNGPADVQRSEIQILGLESHFNAVFIEGEMGYGKPEPRLFRLAEETVGCSPGELLFVGNSYRHDIRPAIDAGWRAAWVRRDSDVAPSSASGRPEELPVGAPSPTLEISSLKELMQPLLG
jgi:putative hydrolase of the HAD superfamily